MSSSIFLTSLVCVSWQIKFPCCPSLNFNQLSCFFQCFSDLLPCHNLCFAILLQISLCIFTWIPLFCLFLSLLSGCPLPVSCVHSSFPNSLLALKDSSASSPEGDDDGDSADSDSSSEVPGAETCAICLGRMRGEVGSPESCDHTFCLICILEWAKVGCSSVVVVKGDWSMYNVNWNEVGFGSGHVAKIETLGREEWLWHWW